eukprot:scaffold68915_cov63-Phaeocystis_antarctica.AAC.1
MATATAAASAALPEACDDGTDSSVGAGPESPPGLPSRLGWAELLRVLRPGALVQLGAGLPPPPAARFVRLELPRAPDTCAPDAWVERPGQQRFHVWQVSTAPRQTDRQTDRETHGPSRGRPK